MIAIGVLWALLVGCGLVGDERATDRPADLSTTTTEPPVSSTTTSPPTTTTTVLADAGPLQADAVSELDPADFPPLFEPPLLVPATYPRTPEFCAAGVRMNEMANNLFEAPADTDPAEVNAMLRAYFYQFARVVALAPPETAAPAAIAKRVVFGDADRLNSVRTLPEFREMSAAIVSENPDLQGAINEMIAWCGAPGPISITPRI